MSKEIINIGILGTANIGKKAIIPNLVALSDRFNILGIGSRDAEKGRKFANGLSIPFLGDYQDVLDTKDIQAVYIPLPNALHFEWIKKAIDKGLHVLSEKSLGCTLNEVSELTDLALKKETVLMENFQFRFHHQLKYIDETIASGKIGAIKNIKSYFGCPPFKDANNIRYKKDLGGGALLDVGAYPLKIVQYFLGSDIYVSDAVLEYDSERHVDIGGGGFIKKKDSRQHAFVAFGFDNAYQCSIDIWGSRGRISTNRIFTAPPGYQPEIFLETPSGKENIVLDADNHYRNMLCHFHELITTTKKLAHEYGQNVSQARLIQQFFEHANEK